ncbi:MAG: hypothetical protein HY718_20690 [Planctomycetes bacterium]|nr:hypothetical protein [Planctomycetota bacterium]
MRHLSVVMLMVVLAVAGWCLGQATQPAASAPATAALVIPKGELGPNYIDGSFGFSVRPIAGARIDRRKRTVEGRLQLAQFARLEVAWSMAVRLWATARPVDAMAASDALMADLGPHYPDLRVARAEAVKIAARDAVRLEATFSAEGRTWLRQQAVIPLRSRDYIQLVLTTPADDRDVAERSFGQIVESFTIARTEVQQQQLDDALERGTALLQSLAGAPGKIAGQALDQPLYLRVVREGTPVGFFEIRERAATIERSDGLQVLQRAWLFGSDGSVQYVQEDKFLANDLTCDEWRNVVQLMPSPQVDPKQRLVVSIEGGIRRNDQIVVDYTDQVGVSDKQTKAIQVEPSYAAALWPLLLPRLVDLSKPELYAFSMYDSDRRGLILRVFRVVGPVRVLAGGRRVSAVRIEDSEGLLPPVSEIDVDEKGRPVRVSAGPVEMTVATAAQVEQEFGLQVKAAQARFRETAGLPPPSAAAGSQGATGGQPKTSAPPRSNRNPPAPGGNRGASRSPGTR